MNLEQAAAAAGVPAATLQAWVQAGLIPSYDGAWSPAAVGQARMVLRIRDRGHTVEEIRAATEDGRLASGNVAELFGLEDPHHTLDDAAAETGLTPDLVRTLMRALGLRPALGLSSEDIELLRYVAAVLEAGLPLDAVLQLTRVYGQSISQIADAEVRLVHLYVHEPMMRSGSSADEMAHELFVLVGELMPLAAPLLSQLHRRLLAHFIEQDIVGHMESALAPVDGEVGRMRVAIAFADLAGYTRLTEEAGDRHALDAVARFIDAVTGSLPEEARVVKTIGDEVMIVGPDPAALAGWAVGFQTRRRGDPAPRIAIHAGDALYRDGDYYGRDINLASRVAARSGPGEVLVTRPVVGAVGDALAFELIAEVPLRGFAEPTEIFKARPRTGT